MQMRSRLEALVEEMLDLQIRLDEALGEFERVYIQKALQRNAEHLSKTAKVLGIHRNTLSKRVTDYQRENRAVARAKRAGR
jgi:DNA-binding NtrC family response regulator